MFKSLTDLGWLVGLIALHLFLPAGSAASQPNIIFVLADDHRYDALSCLGHAFIKTPNIDRIADDGVIFENFFVTSSLCSPSRASFLTGAYAHNHKAVINDWCDPQLEMFPEMLQKLGYETAYIGKWHLARHNNPRPGFDHWFSFTGQGKYDKNTFNENGKTVVIERYITDELNDRALAFIKQKRNKPFAIYLSHKAIHGPFTPADRHQDLYAGEPLLEPETWNDPMEDKPDEIRRIMSRGMSTIGEREAKILWEAGKAVPRMEMKPVEKKLAPRKWDSTQEKKRDYYRAISAVDDGVGAIYEQLEKQGILDNTIIIYAGDNGFGAGEHRRYGGKRVAYEESLRVPFIMRYPGVFPGNTRVDEMCLNIDLAPTLVEAAGGAPPDSIDGESFLELAQGKNVNWRDSFLYEYYREPWTQRYPSIVGVRTKDWKYLTYPDSAPDAVITDEMYNLENDVIETKNLSLSPEFSRQKQTMVDELDQLKQDFGYQSFSFAEVYSERPEPEFWYEDNNQHRGGGIPPDFKSKFSNPDAWAKAREKMDVYMIRSVSLKRENNQISNRFIRETMAPVLKEAGIPVALDAGSATFRNAGRKEGYLEEDIPLIKTMLDAGIEIRSISLQSILSKPLFKGPLRKTNPPYPMEKRYQDVLDAFHLYKRHFPDIAIGIIDALPPHNEDYETPYRELKDVLAEEGYTLDHILLDIPVELPDEKINGNSWPKTKAVEQYVRNEIRCDFGMIAASKTAGNTSDKAYHEAMLKLIDRCREHKINPDYFIYMSWFPHPERSTPDNAGKGKYPSMKTFVEMVERHAN